MKATPNCEQLEIGNLIQEKINSWRKAAWRQTIRASLSEAENKKLRSSLHKACILINQYQNSFIQASEKYSKANILFTERSEFLGNQIIQLSSKLLKIKFEFPKLVDKINKNCDNKEKALEDKLANQKLITSKLQEQINTQKKLISRILETNKIVRNLLSESKIIDKLSEVQNLVREVVRISSLIKNKLSEDPRIVDFETNMLTLEAEMKKIGLL